MPSRTRVKLGSRRGCAASQSRLRNFLQLLWQVPLLALITCFFFSPVEALSHAPSETLEGVLAQARELEQKEDYAGAEKVYQHALSLFPDQPEIFKRLAILYQTELKFPESIDLFQKVLSAAPRYPEVNFYLGLSYLGLNQHEKALKAFDAELKANPRYRRAHYYAAMVLQAINRKEEAVPHLEALVREDPKDVKAWYQLARLYKSLGLQAFNQLALLDPDSAQLHALRAESYTDSGKSAEAIREYQDVLKRQPGFPGVHFALGEIYYRMTDFPGAEKELRLALQEDPNHAVANYYLADILLTGNKNAEALPLLQASVAADPNFVKAYVELGRCYRLLGDAEKALPVLLKAVELEPNSKAAHYQLALVYGAMKNTEKREYHTAIFTRLTKEEAEKDLKETEKFRLRESSKPPTIPPKK